MKKWLTLLIVLILPALVAADDFQVTQDKEHQYIRLLKGTEHGLTLGSGGEVFNFFREKIGDYTIITEIDKIAIARLTMAEKALVSDIDRVVYKNDKVKYNDINFKEENSPSYFTFTNVPDQEITVGMKGKLKGEDGQVVGFFRVISVDGEKSTIVAFSMAVGKIFDEIKTGEFQNYIEQILGSTGLVNFDWKNLVMIIIGFIFLYLAIVKDFEPLLLLPIGFGILIGNIPLPVQLFNNISVYMIDPITLDYVFNTNPNSVFGVIYSFVTSGLLPPLIFLGIGAMTDFTALLANPKTVLLGAAAQVGIFVTFLGALLLGFSPAQAASIGIIGGADGPTAIFLTSQLAPTLIGPIAISAYSYMGLIPIIQPPLMRLLTGKKERLIKMKASRKVSQTEKIIFPIAAFLITTMLAPGAIPLLGMLFFGNLLKESGVTNRLAKTASNAIIDTAATLLGVGVGASTTAQVFLNEKSIFIFILGCVAFGVATMCGILFAKFMNLFLKEGNKINPLIGSAGVSAVPDAARVSEIIGREYDPNNHLLMHAMGPNVAGVIGSGIAAGILLGIF